MPSPCCQDWAQSQNITFKIIKCFRKRILPQPQVFTSVSRLQPAQERRKKSSGLFGTSSPSSPWTVARGIQPGQAWPYLQDGRPPPICPVNKAQTQSTSHFSGLDTLPPSSFTKNHSKKAGSTCQVFWERLLLVSHNCATPNCNHPEIVV